MHSQKQQNDLGSFPKQTIHHHSDQANAPTTNPEEAVLNCSMKTYKTF